ncbi:hypothetical protein HanIR_Chr17g0879651 [Helianthus annuus]|nr:hypothetical protein HanIR_Chr17g0879651 [Helianthus annuus]
MALSESLNRCSERASAAAVAHQRSHNERSGAASATTARGMISRGAIFSQCPRTRSGAANTAVAHRTQL